MMFDRNLIINNTTLGDSCPPYVIAEMSGNHNSSIDRAKQLIDAAFNAGASAIKLQTYTADSQHLILISPNLFYAQHVEG